jgi:hypothetical protein
VTIAFWLCLLAACLLGIVRELQRAQIVPERDDPDDAERDRVHRMAFWAGALRG